jgi:hypothetical protein
MSDKLHQRFQLHIRADGGSTYGYVLTRGPNGPVVGHMSSYVPSERAKRKGEKARTIYTLGDREFVNDAAGLLKAYEQFLRDSEWDAAATGMERSA